MCRNQFQEVKRNQFLRGFRVQSSRTDRLKIGRTSRKENDDDSGREVNSGISDTSLEQLGLASSS